jgi:phosphoglycolate phosphatase
MKYRHKPRSKLGAVIFDLDGTLVDSAADIASSLNHALSCEGLATVPLANVRTMIGDGVAALVRKAIDHQGAAVDPDRCNRVTERFMTFAHSVPVNASTLYPGTENLLRRLRRDGVRLGVCTNKPHDLAGRVLQMLGAAEIIDGWIGGGHFAMKPDPSSLLAVIEELGATPDATVYVGDMRVDYLTALNADTAFIGVNYGAWRYDLPDMDKPCVVMSMEELRKGLVAE